MKRQESLLSLSLLSLWGYSEKKAMGKPGVSSPNTESTAALILGRFPSLQNWEINIGCLSHSVNGYFVIAVQTEQDKWLYANTTYSLCIAVHNLYCTSIYKPHLIHLTAHFSNEETKIQKDQMTI